MWKPIRLKIKNFQSFSDEDYDFEQGKALSIEGENLTDEGQRSNGSGKSSFTDAIYYLLLGVSSTGKRDTELIRRGEKECTLYLSLEEKSLGEIMEIERHIFSGSKSAVVEIKINNEDMRGQYSSVLEANKFILDKLDLSSEDIRSYFLVSRDKFVSFFDSSDSAKRTLLSRFSSVERLEKLRERLSAEQKEDETLIRGLEMDRVKSDAIISALLTQLDEIKIPDAEELEESLKEGIRKSESSIKELLSQIEGERGSLSFLENAAGAYNRALKRISSIDYISAREGLLDKISSLKREASEYSDKAEEIKSEIRSLKEDSSPLRIAIKGSVTCPKCSFVFNPSSPIDIQEAEALLKDIDEELGNMENNARGLMDSSYSILHSDKRKEIETEIENNKKKETRKDRIKKIIEDSARRLSFDISSSQGRIRDMERRLHAEEENRAILEARLSSFDPESAISSYEVSKRSINAKILSEKENLKKIDKRLSEVSKRIESAKIWNERFQQFYIYLTNTSLKAIENRCNFFLEKMGCDLSVVLEGFKKLSGGKIRDSINGMACRGAGVPSSFRCFSGGERGRLVFSTILSLQDMVNQESRRGLDLLMIDEVLDQVDSEGMESFLRTLNGLGRTIFLTSQIRTEKSESSVLLIRKSNGISKIVK